ncbi:hypothetical protein PH505_ak00410 [Pseudoalteromonas distincta]|nr:hypothetical protein PH505_ak00410 [Pseudoalteromonas distincta]
MISYAKLLKVPKLQINATLLNKSVLNISKHVSFYVFTTNLNH